MEAKQGELEFGAGEKMLVDNGDAGEKIPTIIIPTEPIGSPEANTEEISESTLEGLAREVRGESAEKKPETEPRYYFELDIGGRKIPFPFDPEKGALRIGRGIDCHVQILNKTVSRKHAEITYNPKGSECSLRDWGSKNGTYVGGE
ncbi:MAG: FHA domain-containing protein, partial [archaeon]|nr:FHA domain-containing protein [archaeon]